MLLQTKRRDDAGSPDLSPDPTRTPRDRSIPPEGHWLDAAKLLLRQILQLARSSQVDVLTGHTVAGLDTDPPRWAGTKIATSYRYAAPRCLANGAFTAA